jgi:hypothetical protein
MSAQYGSAKGIPFAHGGRFDSGHFSGQIQSPGIQMPENNDSAVIVSGIFDHLADK